MTPPDAPPGVTALGRDTTGAWRRPNAHTDAEEATDATPPAVAGMSQWLLSDTARDSRADAQPGSQRRPTHADAPPSTTSGARRATTKFGYALLVLIFTSYLLPCSAMKRHAPSDHEPRPAPGEPRPRHGQGGLRQPDPLTPPAAAPAASARSADLPMCARARYLGHISARANDVRDGATIAARHGSLVASEIEYHAEQSQQVVRTHLTEDIIQQEWPDDARDESDPPPPLTIATMKIKTAPVSYTHLRAHET